MHVKQVRLIRPAVTWAGFPASLDKPCRSQRR